MHKSTNRAWQAAACAESMVNTCYPLDIESVKKVRLPLHEAGDANACRLALLPPPSYLRKMVTLNILSLRVVIATSILLGCGPILRPCARLHAVGRLKSN